MKKLLYVFCMLLALASCTKVGPAGPAGRDGVDGVDGAMIRNIINVEVKSNQWEYTFGDDNNLYYAQVALPEMTKDIFDYAILQVYMISKLPDGREIQTLLPSVRHYEEISGADTFYYTQTTDYEYWVGRIEFHITNSDFFYNPSDVDNEPGDRRFRVVIMY